MNFTGVNIACIGDLILDRYVYGVIERISPEAPIPVLRLGETREMLGGVGNVAHNIATLGGQAVMISLAADDLAGNSIRRLIDGISGIECGIVSSPLRQTISKTRYIAGRQQMIRTDDESALALQPIEEQSLISEIERRMEGAHGVVLSDYGKAVLSSNVIAAAIRLAKSMGIPVFVDPKGHDFSRYSGATCITPNLRELALASHLPVDTEASAIEAANRVREAADSDAILVTRSEKGMILVERDGTTRSLPARAREVFDVSGAGDTVIATMALAHSSGMPLGDAMRVANAAAGVVVSKFGTATVSISEVANELDEEDGGASRELSPLYALDRALVLIAQWKHRGLKVGFTNGCFDIVHPGHVSLLRSARSQCNRLVVALNSDESIRRLKGEKRPINDLSTRAQVIGSIKYVDCVISFDSDTPLELIARIMPDVLIKGGDYTIDQVVGADIVIAGGGAVHLADVVDGFSVSGIINRLSGQAHETGAAH